MRAAKNELITAEKNVVARLSSKKFLKTFTRKTMIDLGTLRRAMEVSTGGSYVPPLDKQIEYDMQSYRDDQDQLDE